MLLIYPPLTKACEPPGGVALLGGVLKSHGVSTTILDLNCEFQNYLLDKHFKDKPSKKNYRDQLTSLDGYRNFDKYKRAIYELNKALSIESNGEISLSNYTSKEFDPLSSKDIERVQKEYRSQIFFPFYKERLDDLLGGDKHEHVGISLQFINQVMPAFSLIGFIKDCYPEVKIVIGGGLITSWTRSEGWKNQIDVHKIISGQGEYQLLEYLGYRPDQDRIETSLPDYSFAKKLKYFAPDFILPVSNSYGCSWKRCKFCPEVSENSPFIPLKSRIALERLEDLVNSFTPGLVHILDNEINPSLLKLLSQSRLKSSWYGFTRFYKDLESLEFCKSLKLSGCSMLKLGLESGDQRVLDDLDKGVDLNSASIILKNLEKAGISTFVYFLFGTPYDNRESAFRTKEFIVKHATSITYMNLAIFNLPKGSELCGEVETFDLSSGDLSLYKGFNHPDSWGRIEIRRFIKKELEGDRSISEIIKRTPPLFGANHGAFLNT